jgi:hypothetical protein
MSPAIGVARQAGARTSLSRALSWAQPNDDESDHFNGMTPLIIMAQDLRCSRDPL